MDEAGRVPALRRYRILDTEPEQAFDDQALLPAQSGTPIALVSLADAEDLQQRGHRVSLHRSLLPATFSVASQRRR